RPLPRLRNGIRHSRGPWRACPPDARISVPQLSPFVASVHAGTRAALAGNRRRDDGRWRQLGRVAEDRLRAGGGEAAVGHWEGVQQDWQRLLRRPGQLVLDGPDLLADGIADGVAALATRRPRGPLHLGDVLWRFRLARRRIRGRGAGARPGAQGRGG